MAGWSRPTANDWESDNANCNLLVNLSIRISHLPFNAGRSNEHTYNENLLNSQLDADDSACFKRA
ncbi:hypothetical protein KPSA1_00832 [Pseudomonas syringae pv. actinidiae]|uniref:Uncharacterized protein n=1 Tax=Pseudomonas syringae pv. actinidiae TaxID=103796 RepID=A0A2V0Q5Q7_PSESF|nr:hypothetical protein KPSA1_00832 [Pseudomonas syringae pv. actinidiae]